MSDLEGDHFQCEEEDIAKMNITKAYAEKIQKREQAYQDKRRAEEVLARIEETKSIDFFIPPGRVINVFDPDIVGAVKSMLHLKAGALSRVINSDR